jgi:hypothetical protein
MGRKCLVAQLDRFSVESSPRLHLGFSVRFADALSTPSANSRSTISRRLPSLAMTGGRCVPLIAGAITRRTRGGPTRFARIGPPTRSPRGECGAGHRPGRGRRESGHPLAEKNYNLIRAGASAVALDLRESESVSAAPKIGGAPWGSRDRGSTGLAAGFRGRALRSPGKPVLRRSASGWIGTT